MKCKIKSCERDAKTKTGYCLRCASFNRYWQNRNQIDRGKHLAKLRMWAQRANQVIK